MTDLSKAERRWLDRPDDEGRRRRTSAAALIRTATDRHRQAAGEVGQALLNATCTVPPQQRGGRTAPGGGLVDVADRTLAQIEATVGAVDRALTRLGHLLDRCPACPTSGRDEVPPGCNSIAVDTLADLTGRSWPEVADHCTGVSPTSPAAVEAAVRKAVEAHQAGAKDLHDQWTAAWRGGSESRTLDDWAHAANRLSLSLAALADSLGQWRSGVLVRTCACADPACCPGGCRAAAPPRGEGATCGRCRNRQYQKRRASA
jgi:hypothetical protein